MKIEFMANINIVLFADSKPGQIVRHVHTGELLLVLELNSKYCDQTNAVNLNTYRPGIIREHEHVQILGSLEVAR